MNRTGAFAFVLVSLAALLTTAIHPAQASADSWVPKAPMQEARGRLGVAAVNGKLYAIGGAQGSILAAIIGPYIYDSGDQIVNITEEYDPATDTWTFKASMPTPRIYFGIAVYENRIYCIGGEKLGGITGANEIYDPATDTWETKESMPVAARFQMANIVDGKIYVIGAVDPGSLNQVYDPETDSWTTKTPPPTQIWSLASAVFNDKIYLIDIDGFVQIYDPANDSWSTGAKAPLTEAPGQIYPLDTATAAVTSGAYAPKRIYFFDEAATHVYDPANDRTVGAAMPTARGFAGAVVINDTIYAVGGVTFQYSSGYMGPTAANEQYTPIGYGTVQPVNSLTWLVYAIAAGATASAVAVSAGLIVYFNKHRNQTSPRT